MTFCVKTTAFFLEQARALSPGSKKLVDAKIDLIKQNPYRFKRIHSKRFSKLFRVRLNLDGAETRLVYAVIEPNVVIACLLERKNDYRDLEKYLKKAGLA